jgi:hypothetical protein
MLLGLSWSVRNERREADVGGFEPRRQTDGTIVVPFRLDGPNGEIGEGLTTIGPDDSEYARWDTYLRSREGDS